MNIHDIRERLLDLGKTNRLIQFRDSKKTSIDVIHPTLNTVFVQLLKGKSWEVFDIDSLRMELEKKEKQYTLLEETPPKVDLIETAKKRIKNNQILLHKKDLPTRTVIKEIAKKAKEGLSEKGINTLYAAFGFIRWKEDESSKDYLTSPLLIVPISIRQNFNGAFLLSTYEDEVILNPALIFKLRSDYKIQIPDYNSESDEEDLSIYFDKVNNLITPLGWQLMESVKIGFFSFTKMNMYYDLLVNEGEVLESELVQSILDPRKTQKYAPDDLNTDPRMLDVTINAVVNADSSQLEAIQLSKRNISFVLQGPPGTGKSQTITNIIAEAIMDGKSVLFVSEKIAALRVVYSNLKKAELDQFCLEIHSHKANKKEVINEVYRTLMAEKTAVRETVALDLNALQRNKQELDDYEAALHQKHSQLEMTPYQVYSYLAKLDEIPMVSYLIPGIKSKPIQHLKRISENVNRFARVSSSISADYRTFPLYGINTEMTYEERRVFESSLERLTRALSQYKQQLSTLSNIIDTPIESIQRFRENRPFFAFLVSSKWYCSDLLTRTKRVSFKALIEKQISLSKSIETDLTTMNKRYQTSIFQLNSKQILQLLNTDFSSIFRIFKSSYRELMRDIKETQRQPNKSLSYKDAIHAMKTLEAISLNKEKRNEIEAKICSRYPDYQKSLDSEYQSILEEVLLWDTFGESRMIPASLSKVNQQSMVVLQKDMKAILDEIMKTEKEYAEDLKLVQRFINPEIFSIIETSVSTASVKINAMFMARSQLENWLLLLQSIRVIKDNQIEPFIIECLDQSIPLDRISLAYHKVYFTQWIHSIIDSTPALSQFHRIHHDEAVRDFQQHDKLRFEIVKAQIRSKLSMHRPNPEMIAPGSPASIIQREYNKKRNILPVRQFLRQTADLVIKIKPCFLMSPLSVSTYFDSSSIHFDMVIFDEASQIFPQDALGAIYRGKQVIVVGDTKQMPPSNFFTAGTSDLEIESEEYTETASDYESILDISNTRFPQKRLKWHYRSRIEDLIAFSNWHYYDNQLVTFPSFIKHGPGFGVELHYVPDGLFNRDSKTNLKEAEKIAQLVAKEIQNHPQRSLGVVAFSLSQQEVIEEYIDKMVEDNPSYASFFDDNKEEPFFVKNLETVQGDERDTIILSIAYGKDLAGKFYHNFGPLNRMGGERRLNVAVTRAKYNVIVVSSIESSDIDLGRTSALGVKHLKTYLEYAEKGPIAIYSQVTETGKGVTESDFEEQVKRFIEQAGYEVDTQIGCSGFRIDLGVKHPSKGDYFIAIECDGATYHSGRNTRDRDRLRQEILERLGWSFYRIWSTDWFRNRENAQRQLLEKLKDQLVLFDSKKVVPEQFNDIPQPLPALSKLVVSQNHFEFPKYISVDTRSIYRKHYQKVDTAIEVIEKEFPIHIDFLLRKVAWMYDRTKVTSAYRNQFLSELRYYRYKGIIFKDNFLYIKHPEAMYELRVPNDNDTPRDIDEIAIEEIAGGMYELIRQNGSVPKMGLFQSLTQILGFKHLGKTILGRMEDSLKYISQLKLVEETELGNIILQNE